MARERQPGNAGSAAVPDEAGGDDASQLARLADGDQRAFATLVARHLPHVLATARRMLRDEAEAEDMAQEALLRLWRGGARLAIGAGGVRPWLRRVVSNLCIDRIRSARNTEVTDEVPEQLVPAAQLDTIAAGEMSARVDQALAALPDRQRAALVLFHYEGMSQAEVGRLLGITDEAVESLLSRARRALKVALKDEWRQLLPEGDGRA